MWLKCCSAPAVSAGRAPTGTVAPHEPLALRLNPATTPGRTSSNKQSQPRRPAELQTPLPSRPALRGEDRTPTPAQPSTAQGRHTQPRRGSAVCWNGSTCTAAAALSLGAATQLARHTRHTRHTQCHSPAGSSISTPTLSPRRGAAPCPAAAPRSTARGASGCCRPEEFIQSPLGWFP